MRVLVLSALLGLATCQLAPAPQPAAQPSAVPQSTRSGCGFLWMFDCDDDDQPVIHKSEPKPVIHKPEPVIHKPEPEPEYHHEEPGCGGGCPHPTTTVDLVCQCRTGCSPDVQYTLVDKPCYCGNGASEKGEDCSATYVLDCEAQALFTIARGACFYIDNTKHCPPADAGYHVVHLTC